METKRYLGWSTIYGCICYVRRATHPGRQDDPASTMAATKRGAFILLEGLDRSGKSSQCKRLAEALRAGGTDVAEFVFPDRTTGIGQMISSYLKQDAELDDKAVHLLFAANRWEKVRAAPAGRSCARRRGSPSTDRPTSRTRTPCRSPPPCWTWRRRPRSSSCSTAAPPSFATGIPSPGLLTQALSQRARGSSGAWHRRSGCQHRTAFFS